MTILTQIFSKILKQARSVFWQMPYTRFESPKMYILVEELFNSNFFSLYVFYCGASETQNLCFVSGENPPVRFKLKCANTYRE